MPDIYVENLPANATVAALRARFEPFGFVKQCSLMLEQGTILPTGMGFVDMPSVDAASRAVHALNGSDFDGRIVVVHEAQRRAGGRRPRLRARRIR